MPQACLKPMPLPSAQQVGGTWLYAGEMPDETSTAAGGREGCQAVHFGGRRSFCILMSFIWLMYTIRMRTRINTFTVTSRFKVTQIKKTKTNKHELILVVWCRLFKFDTAQQDIFFHSSFIQHPQLKTHGFSKTDCFAYRKRSSSNPFRTLESLTIQRTYEEPFLT